MKKFVPILMVIILLFEGFLFPRQTWAEAAEPLPDGWEENPDLKRKQIRQVTPKKQPSPQNLGNPAITAAVNLAMLTPWGEHIYNETMQALEDVDYALYYALQDVVDNTVNGTIQLGESLGDLVSDSLFNFAMDKNLVLPDYDIRFPELTAYFKDYVQNYVNETDGLKRVAYMGPIIVKSDLVKIPLVFEYDNGAFSRRAWYIWSSMSNKFRITWNTPDYNKALESIVEWFYNYYEPPTGLEYWYNKFGLDKSNLDESLKNDPLKPQGHGYVVSEFPEEVPFLNTKPEVEWESFVEIDGEPYRRHDVKNPAYRPGDENQPEHLPYYYPLRTDNPNEYKPIPGLVPINPTPNNPGGDDEQDPGDSNNPNPGEGTNPNPGEGTNPKPGEGEGGGGGAPNPEKPKNDWKSRMKALVTTKFPFSLPWDFATLLGFLNAEPVVPNIDSQINVLGKPIHLQYEFDAIEPYRPFIHAFIIIAFCIMLIMYTRNLLGGSV